jgi:cob(I)alamin adenosyltransferase
MAIYTRTGDQGETDLPDGSRVPKDAALIEVLGTLDELSALLGLARCESLPEGYEPLLEQIQRQLFQVGAELATVAPGQAVRLGIGPEQVATLEQRIDRQEATLESPGTFLLPAGSRAAAVLHLARAVCRRAERRLVSLAGIQPRTVSPGLLAYLNRLSDLLYILARAANARSGIADTPC